MQDEIVMSVQKLVGLYFFCGLFVGILLSLLGQFLKKLVSDKEI